MTPAEALRALEVDRAVTVVSWELRSALDRRPRIRAPDEDGWCRIWDGVVLADHPRFVRGALALGHEASRVRDAHREQGLRSERVVRPLRRRRGLPTGLRVLVQVAVPRPEPDLSDEGWAHVFVEALVAGRSVAEADRLCRAMLGAGVHTDHGRRA